MKRWETPIITELDINKTEHGFLGDYDDGAIFELFFSNRPNEEVES